MKTKNTALVINSEKEIERLDKKQKVLQNIINSYSLIKVDYEKKLNTFHYY